MIRASRCASVARAPLDPPAESDRSDRCHTAIQIDLGDASIGLAFITRQIKEKKFDKKSKILTLVGGTQRSSIDSSVDSLTF